MRTNKDVRAFRLHKKCIYEFGSMDRIAERWIASKS